MTAFSEAEVLANVFANVHTLTKFYLIKLKDADKYKVFHAGENWLNSAYWVTAHIVWASHYLLVEGLDFPKMDYAWLEEFRFGSTPVPKTSWPDYSELIGAMDKVHLKALQNIRSLSGEKLDEPNVHGITILGENSKRIIIHHAIRHEPYHAGQLGWICKLNGIRTV